MGIGAISGAAYPTYIYNTNRISPKSLNKISAVPEDALSGRIGYDSEQNENPLKVGETKDWAGILESQMASSAMNAARVMQDSIF